MARVNFGRSPTVRGYNPMENTLKPGYIIKLRGKFYAVDSVEGLTYDLVVTAQGNTNGTEVSDAYDKRRKLLDVTDEGDKYINKLIASVEQYSSRH